MSMGLLLGLLPKDWTRDWTSANLFLFTKREIEGDRHVAANYRPIGLTSIVLKRINCRKLTEALEKCNFE